MADETENLVLEPLRGRRADMAAMDRRFDGVDGIETRKEGWRPVVATTGSLVTDMKHRDTRIVALEGARA